MLFEVILSHLEVVQQSLLLISDFLDLIHHLSSLDVQIEVGHLHSLPDLLVE